MKLKTGLLYILMACAPAGIAFAQPDCNVSNKLICQFPISAQVLATNVTGTNPSSPAYQAAYSSALKAAGAINEAVAAQLTQLPVPSATVGVVSLRRQGHEGGVPFSNLGPILTDRPDTVGKGHFFSSFNYQHFNFNAIDGNDLGTLPIGFNFQIPNSGTTFFGSTTNRISFQLDQYVWLLTYGLNKNTDLSVIVPLNHVNLDVTSSNFTALEQSCPTCQYNSVPGNHNIISTAGSATGIGDVVINAKHMFVGLEGNRPAVAIGATFRFPTGDSFNYLGSGALGGSLYTLMEYRARIAPHTKIGYQWNGSSQALNLSAGNAPRLPGGLQYAIGTDAHLIDRVTVAADILGNQTLNGGTFNTTSQSVSTSLGSATLYSTIAGTHSYTTVHFSGGVKFSPRPGLIVYGNVLLQLNDVGLRSDPVPLFGIAYNYHRHSKAD